VNKKIKLLALACIAIAAGIAATPELHAQSSTTVRFRLSYGSTFFGDIDVDLYDADKPNTVSNFLAYVEGGAYDNSILHECIPGLALVGGLATVPNPFSSAPFELMARIPENAPITNEFDSGTLRSNVLGTLSMLKETNSADSATTRWFFNLGDNTDGTGVTNLDAFLGGHTVFGQVRAGTSMTVLQYFNTFEEYEGIQNTTNEFHAGSCALLHRYPDGANVGFPALPVGFTGLDCIRYNDLFNVQVFVLSGADKTKPKVTITLPAANLPVTSDDVAVSAVVSDNVGIDSVRVYLNTNAPVAAAGDGIWNATLTGVPPGTNVVVVEAIDTSGNRTLASRTFFHSIRRPLSLNVANAGIVSGIGAINGALLEVGSGYSFVALPAPGFLFVGWTGTVHSASANLKFIMESNTALTAVFTANPFPSIKGTYTGLFYDTNVVDQQSSGYLTLTLGTFGTYSARMQMSGKTHRFTGTFSTSGGETNFVTRRGTNDVLVRLSVDLFGGTDQLTGIVSNFVLNATETNIWQAELMADRAVFNPKLNPAGLAGSYTMLVPLDTSSPTGPTGDGFGRVKVNAGGKLAFHGTLADGTKAVQRSFVSKTGEWPLYLSLHKGKGALVSWVNFNTNGVQSNFSGLLTWIKQSQPTAKYYSGGFTNETEIEGSKFIPPSSAEKVVDLSDAIVGFIGGNLGVDFTNSVTLGADSKIVNNSANKLTLNISKATGLFTGTVIPPGEAATVRFKGAILQNSLKGGGFFLGTNAAGRVLFLED
jgi:cyclophilin family peptidyl-prolyl cis-trans isomerase